jgi:glutamate-1-semialdehyde 2,1-aminomutase
MAHLSPEGGVYQAGTLSGNPVAMAAGLASIGKIKQNSRLYGILEGRAKRLMQGFSDAAAKHNIGLQTDVRGSMFGFFFCDVPVNNFADALKSDTVRFAKFHVAMLDAGFYFACSQFETGFISTAITDMMIEDTIAAANKIFGDL